MYIKNTANYKFYIASSVIVILLLWIWMQKSTINSLKVLNSEMTHEISADGRYMATQRQNIMDLESALKSGLLEKERYMKNVKAKSRLLPRHWCKKNWLLIMTRWKFSLILWTKDIG